MPITFVTMLIGNLALIGFPGFSGFFSKDLILESIFFSKLPFAEIAYYIIYISVFVTAFYSFRLFFLVFYTTEYKGYNGHVNEHDHEVHEVKPIIYIPLILLAIPSIFIGYFFVNNVLGFYFNDIIFLVNKNASFYHIKEDFISAWCMFTHGVFSGPCLLGYIGILVAWIFYVYKPNYRIYITGYLNFLLVILKNKYWFDIFNLFIIVPCVLKISSFLYKTCDLLIIDGLLVNGSANLVSMISEKIKKVQTGYIYHYVFILLLFLFLFLLWLVIKT
jgi:NADH-quinone oxidoreductase subunit L